MNPVASLSNCDGVADDALEPLVADLDAAHDFAPAWAAFFCSSLTRDWPTYQSSAVTSSNTTHTASLGSLATSRWSP